MGIQIPKVKTNGEVFDFAECLTPWEFVYFQCSHPYEKLYDRVVMAAGGRIQPIQQTRTMIDDSRQELETFKDALENVIAMGQPGADPRIGIEHAAHQLFQPYQLKNQIPPRTYCILMTDLIEVFKIAAKAGVANDLLWAIRPWHHYWE